MRVYFYLFIFMVGIFSCNSGPEDARESSESIVSLPKKELHIPAFNADSAYSYIEHQVEFGPRVPNSDAHRQTKDYLEQELKKYADKVIIQSFKARRFDKVNLQGYNIIGSFNPQAEKRILLLAHWDSRFKADHATSEKYRNDPVMGADDGGSGVGILLEVARQLSFQPADVGVDILFTDLEDQGKSNDADGTTWGIGAQYWSKNPHTKNFKAKYGILLDMVGAKGARFMKENISKTYAPQFLDYVWNLANSMGYGNLFINKTLNGGVVDDHVYVNQNLGIPTIDIINKPSDNAFGDHWHTEHDTMDIIDKNVLRAVGQVVTAVIYRFDANYL